MKLLLLAGVCALATANAACADEAPANSTVSQVTVTAPSSISDLRDLPTTTESITADEIAKTINVLTPEDVLRYLPDVLIRQRHIGDTQAPVTTRTSGVGASARSLIYVDGVLISALIGNNNSTASPKWGLVAPDAIERVDVLYGPFAAQYAGNSIGSVIAFTTRMPRGFEATAEVQGAVQSFSKYGDDKSYGTGRFAADLGDRFGDLAFRLSYNHLDSHAQPLTYATALAPATTSAAGIPVTGAFSDSNRTGAPIQVLGSMGIEHQMQDNLSGRMTWDLTPEITAAYTFGLFHNGDDATVNSYLRDGSGQPVYAGTVNIGGRAYTLANSAFSNGVYNLEELEVAQGLSLASHTDGVFDFELVATRFDYLRDRQRIPSGALPAAFSGGAGTTTSLDGTGWHTLDAKGTWRPAGSPNVVTFGAHEDGFKLNNPKYALTNWIDGSAGATLTFSRGRTQTQAFWLQDVWSPTPELKATLGGRYEHWRAYDGLNFSVAPALNVNQPSLKKDAFSPKASLAYVPSMDWTFKASAGVAYRFPTVTELYQAITTGALLSVPNPRLKPERALSSELSAERTWAGGSLRVSLFDERITNALLSQTAPLLPGSTSLFSFVQNIDRTHATGVEVVADQRDALVSGLELSGWVTYVEAKTDRDAAFPAAVGKDLPQLPRLRGAVVATYAATPKLALTLAARYSDRSFATIDNSDPYANTYQGFGGYFVADAHALYRLTPHLQAGLGVDNLGGRSYFLFHPFPQRTFVADLKYTF
ncbi:MAG TPA: TonB-dependent receptor [Phenylobacterium sp.]|jgi:iron complex outermembrane receptor protein|uniref:TonB-dependent receptor n=1 Tax=Phenylobacterium sp. TaxID=1871053 RepID=UPI002B923AE8|nr:TonB-dependent receptor [Phenylobacterium sp.]HXA38312.1 TonB-dependent receptor [Phenylobacterium sp.]